eukprot:750414-Hanusia_phi.AAC.8
MNGDTQRLRAVEEHMRSEMQRANCWLLAGVLVRLLALLQLEPRMHHVASLTGTRVQVRRQVSARAVRGQAPTFQ